MKPTGKPTPPTDQTISTANSYRRKWKWLVTGYYNDTVKPPKTPGGLACQVGHDTDWGKDVEVDIFNKREDIGRVTVERQY